MPKGVPNKRYTPEFKRMVVETMKKEHLSKGLAACNSQTASPFSCLNNFYFKILSSFLGSLHLFIFGVLESNVHMAWMRCVCGRLKSDYDYSIKIVYNNFPWPTPTEQQKAKIEQTAQAILDARALYPDSSLADLYDDLTMPPELRKAHQANDRAVMDAYGFIKGTAARTSESACVAELMKLYQQKVSAAQSK